MRMEAKRKAGRSRLMRRRALTGYIFIIPLILGVVFVFVPNLVQTFRFAVNDMELGMDGYTLTPVGFQYFKSALYQDAQFVPKLVESLQNFITKVPIILIFSLFIASLLNTEFHGRGVARVIFFVPVILATGIVANVEATTGIIGIVEDSRALDTGLGEGEKMEIAAMLTSLNLPKAMVDLINAAIAGIYDVVKSSGMQIFILLAGLQEVSPSLYEAAKVEGCNQWSLFWKITLPMIGPQIKVCVVYTIIDILADEKGVLVEYIDGLAFRNNMYAQGTAMYVIYLVCIAVLVAIVLGVMTKLIRYNGEGRN